MKLLIGMGVTHTKAYCFADVVVALKCLRIPAAVESKGLLFAFNTEDAGFHQLFNDMLYKLGIPHMQHNIWPEDNMMANKVAVRNYLLDITKQTECDMLLMLDADICVMPHTLESMVKCAVEKDADAVTVPYNITSPNGVARSVFLGNGKDGELGFIPSETAMPEHIKIDACGMGCILLRREALKVPFRLTDKPEDLQWCEDYAGDIWCCGKESVRHRVKIEK